MAPPTPLAPPLAEPMVGDGLDLDLDVALREAPGVPNPVGVIDLTGRLRPAGPRRSSRYTHTRLTAALARIHADGAASRDTERRTPIR